jgi:hypothetical protein
MTGEHAVLYELANRRPVACTLDGYPAVVLNSASGVALRFRYAEGGGPYVTCRAAGAVSMTPASRLRSRPSSRRSRPPRVSTDEQRAWATLTAAAVDGFRRGTQSVRRGQADLDRGPGAQAAGAGTGRDAGCDWFYPIAGARPTAEGDQRYDRDTHPIRRLATMGDGRTGRMPEAGDSLRRQVRKEQGITGHQN